MTGREAMLRRIREALRLPTAPGPVRAATDAADVPAGERFRRWLPEVGARWEDQVEMFAAYSAALQTTFQVVASLEEAGREVARIARAEEWKHAAAHHAPAVDSALATAGLDPLWTDDGLTTPDLASCDAGITGCACLVAGSGSVLVTSQRCGGRALSVLPPHHVVIAGRDQLVPDLAAAFALLRSTYDGNYPSMMSFITGPSRTGDIERILVLGAHGPRKLTVLLVAD